MADVKSRRILVTEDEMVVALDLELRLKKLGYGVCTLAASGENAIRIAREERPDLVLMDVQLRGGGIDGIEAAREIKAARSVPVIFLTANADEKTLARAKETLPSGYLLKPFKERELQISIDMALANHALQQELTAARDLLESRVKERTAELAAANDNLRQEMQERQRAEAETQQRAALLDKTQDAIFVRTIPGEVLYWNKGAERIYGFLAEDAVGAQIGELIGERRDEGAQRALKAVLADGEWIGELSHVSRKGLAVVVESRWTVVRDAAAILVVNTDITVRKRIQEQILRAQRVESIGALASGIAHDLNNVFTPLLMTAQLIKDVSGPKDQVLADIMVSSAKRGSDMVRQILTFVRGGEGNLKPFRLEHLLREVRELLSETFPKSVKVTLTIGPGLCSVMGDSTRLHQLVMNLCVNARDAMPQGGELTITLTNVSEEDPGFASRKESRPETHLCLSVRDTGTGMDAETKARVFTPFFTTKAPGKGTGLGLATVRTIVNEHDGFLELETAPGRGTEFKVYLPGIRQTAAESSAAEAELPRGGGSLILVADDERSIREIIAATLEAFDYRVVVADDELDALTKFEFQRSDIAAVITDVSMPLMDGRSCIRALRKLVPDLPILLMSGSEGLSSDAVAGDEPAVDLLSKPFTKAKLLLALHQVLKKRQDHRKSTEAESDSSSLMMHI